MNFLDYLGTYDESQNENVDDFYIFHFKNNKFEKYRKKYIVSPFFEEAFKTVFFYCNDGLEIYKEFLNSIFYPESNSIIELKFIQKDIYGNRCIAKIKQNKINDEKEKKNNLDNINKNDDIKYKEIIIDAMMKNFFNQNSKFSNNYFFTTEENDSVEALMIALCLDEDKIQEIYKEVKIYNIEDYKSFDFKTKKMFYEKKYEIYLNGLYNAQNPLSVINNEKIGVIGKEWIKLFCLTLWCKSPDKINFCVPEKLYFFGNKIKTAFDILSNIPYWSQIKIKLKIQEEKLKEEAIIEEMKHKKSIFEKNIKYLDFFYKMFKKNKSIENIDLLIEILDKVSYSLLKNKYGDNSDTERFAKILSDQGLLDD